MLLEKAQEHYEKQVNVGRCEADYEVGQKVLLNVRNFTMPEVHVQICRSVSPRGTSVQGCI